MVTIYERFKGWLSLKEVDVEFTVNMTWSDHISDWKVT